MWVFGGFFFCKPDITFFNNLLVLNDNMKGRFEHDEAFLNKFFFQDISLDYGDKVEEVTLAHKRFNEFSSYELLNPFNLIIDSPMRDIADLFNIDIVNKDNIEQVLNSYNLSQKSASILLARVIYPSYLFDLLEEHYVVKKDIKKELIKYYSSLEERKKKIVFIHNYLTNRYGIRQVNWLLLK